MVRETRYLWIGNLPHTIREDRILEHFKRYGKVQSVKILPKKQQEEDSGACATVAFIDIKSAAKAHNADNKIDDRTLKTDYYEPPASSTASSAIYIHERDDALVRPAPTPYTAGRTPRYGLGEERNYDRPGHYYADREPYMRRPLGIGYHDEDNYQGRAKSRDRYSRSTPGNNYTEGTERNQNHFRPHNARQHFDQQRYPVGDQYPNEREPAAITPRLSRRTTNNTPATPAVASVASPTIKTENRPRRTKRRSPSRTPSGSRSNSGSRSRSSSGSRSSSSSSKLHSTSSDSSGRSRSPSKSRSPVSASYGSQNNTKGSRLDRPSSAIANPSSTVSYLPSTVNASAINCTSNSTQGSTPSQNCTLAVIENHCERGEEKRPLGICVRNLPVRSTDTSLKDGLFHEYKKHGKVTMVKVIGQGTDRYAVVCFKKPEDVDKALEVSKDKLFFGCKIEVTAHEGLDAEDNEFRPLEAELDEFHPKATRTLFIGNLEKDVTTPELRKHFDQFGEIIEIDIKKQGSATSYAFIQYSDIGSVVKAMRKLDGENLGANRIKLGFGKSMPTNCVWLDGIVDSVSDKFLARHFSRFGIVAYTAVDREKGHALVFYENVEFAQIAVSEMRGRILQGKKLQVDFASRECQTTFFDKLEMTGQLVPGDGTRPWERRERRGPEFEVVRNDDREPRVGFENRPYPRYEGQPRPPRGNFRGGQRAGFSSRGRGQGFSARYEVYHDEFGERRHRYNSREEIPLEVTMFDGKAERPKYVEVSDCPNRKRNKLRNSISDQESHHSQSPPRSCHQSRSTSPVSKDRKSLKDRIHHRIKSPGSHNSSLVNSPCRDTVSDEMENISDYRDSRSKSDTKSDDIATELSYTSPRSSSEKDCFDKVLSIKVETDSLKSRLSLDAESADESTSASDQLGQLERKKRLLASSNLKGGKELNVLVSKSLNDRGKAKLPNSHVNSLKPAKVNCVSDAIVDDSKCDIEVGTSQQECVKEKPQQTESANTDLKYLQKKQVHLLHLLEQLGENANSSDAECLIDSERLGLKKHRSPSSCLDTNPLFENDGVKSLTKDACGILLCKDAIKDPSILTKLKTKADGIDGTNCISLSLDSFIFQKHLDPRKGSDQHSVSSGNTLQKCRRISVDNETCLPNAQGAIDSFLCAPSPITADVSWKKECNLLSDNFPDTDTDCSLSVSHMKIENVSDDDAVSCKRSLNSSFSLDLPNRLMSLRTVSDIRHEIKRERDISPLSLPLPKFAASLRSPKSSPSVLTSPKSTTAHSPRAGLSPSSYVSGKNIRIADLFQDFQLEKKTKESVPDERVNGVNVSPSDSISPFESQTLNEVSETMSNVEPIQSPKSNSEKVKESHSSSESECSPSASPNRPSIEDRIKALDEKFNAWSGSTRTAVATTPDVVPVTIPEVPKCPVKRSRFNFLAPEIRSEPSEIVKSILARSTIFDQDSKRLQHIDEKYEPLNIKVEPSPKVKPTFRTKAAAKEFSTPITPAIPTFNQSSLVKAPTLVAQGIISPPATPLSGVAGSVLSPITPPLQPYNAQLTPQVFTPCSPCATPFTLTNCAIKTADGITSFDKDLNDHVLKSSNIFNSLKSKTEQNFHVNSSALATSLKSPLHCSVDVPAHALVLNSPPGIKKEPSSPTDSVTETVCKFEIDCKVPMKKEAPSHIVTNIPLRKDTPVSLTKDHLQFNSLDHDKREFCDPKDPRLSFHEGSSHWRENGCKDEIKVSLDSCAKSFMTDPGSDTMNPLCPATKKRVSSIDSTESESSKSVKSLDSSRDSQEISWSKHDKASEPEPKKLKLSKSAVRDRSMSPPMQQHSRKNEKKEKTAKTEKAKSSASKPSSSSNPEKSKTDSKCNVKLEPKDKVKSDHKHKDEKRSKSRDFKESTSNKEQRTKSRERSNSEKDNRCGISNNPSNKSKKDSHSSKNEGKYENKSENKHDNRSEFKHENKNESKPENKSENKHENKSENRHEIKSENRHENKSENRQESKSENRHENKSENRHESKSENRHEGKSENRHENKSENRHESKSENRHESKSENRHEGKSENRHEGKSENRHEGKSENRHEGKSENRHENKSENRHESRKENKGENKHKSKNEIKYEIKNESESEGKSEDAKSDKKQGEKKSSSKKSSSVSSLPFDFQAFMDDEPVYFSMYDKVKARSSKSQVLKHQTSDLESVRQKFSKLKQSRAKREEKTKSIDQDSDRDSDFGSHHSSESDSQAKSTKVKQPRKRKLVIESSSDDDAAPHDSSSRISKMEKDFSDSATDSDFEYNVSRRQSSNLKVRKKKPDLLDSDSSDSDSNFAAKSQTNSKKKPTLSRSKPRPEKTKKIIKSDFEVSDLEMQHRNKEKDVKLKKFKKDKTVELKPEHESMDFETQKKSGDDSKSYKKKTVKDSRQELDVSFSQKKLKSDHPTKEKIIPPKERKNESSNEKMQVDDIEKHKPYSKKRKKSKKMSKNKERRSTSDKVLQDSRKHDDSDAKSSLPVLSPKPSNTLPDKQLSPPCLQAGVFSDNDFKSDFSDFDFEVHHSDDIDINSDLWKQLDVKSDSNSEKSSKSKKKDSVKSQSAVIHSPEQDSSLPSFFDKLSDITDSETGKEPTDCMSDVPSDGQKQDFLVRKEKDVNSSPYKNKHEKHDDHSTKPELNKYSDAHSTSSKDERRKKKSKKQSKEKKKKSREEKEVPLTKDVSPSAKVPSPKPLFEPLAADEDSRLSELHLDEGLLEETRHFEDEFLVVPQEMTAFGDDGPSKREEKLLERRFEEEAAKETRRLEAELFSTGRDSWHMKEKDYDSEANSNELCEDKLVGEIDSITGKEENIFTGLDLHTSATETPQNETDVFLSGHSESDPYKLDDKDINEIEDQRKIEDDLAVSALLQEMHCGEISAPELTKETDYLDPLIETHPEDTMNYLLPDDGENSLHIADSSPDVQGNESQDEKLESSVMLLSPASNSEPPALEISNVEDSVLMKIESSNPATLPETLKVETTPNESEISKESKPISCYEFHDEDSMDISESKPPVIDIPVIPEALEQNKSSVSPKGDRAKVIKGRGKEKPFSVSVKLDSNEDTDNESGSELTENQLTHFEDITMDTTDSKDDDNPPILIPVESPRNLLTAPEPKQKVPSTPVEENQGPECLPTKSSIEHVELAESVFDKLSSDIDKQFGEILNRISEQPKTENKSYTIPQNRCPMPFDVSDFNSNDSLLINNTELFDTCNDSPATIKPYDHNDNTPDTFEEESSRGKYNLTEPVNSLLDPPLLNHPGVLSSTSEIDVSQPVQKVNDDTVDKLNLQNPEPFTETGVISAISDANHGSSDSFLLDLFGPKSVENETVDNNCSEKLKTDEDLVYNSDSKNKNEDSDISSTDNNQSSHATTSFEISEVNEQNEATEFNQEIFERASDSNKDSKLPQLLSFSADQLFNDLKNKSHDINEDLSLNATKILANDPDISPTIDASVQPEKDSFQFHSEDLDSSEKFDVQEKLDDQNYDISDKEHFTIEDSLDIKSRPADSESVCSDTTDITISDTKGDAEVSQLISTEEPLQELQPVENPTEDVKPKTDRPRRGRRPKTRRYVETLSQKPDTAAKAVVNVTNTRSSSRRARPTSSETCDRVRRSLRSDTSEPTVLREFRKKRYSVDEIVHSETEDIKKDMPEEIGDVLVSDSAIPETDNGASNVSAEIKSADKSQVKHEEPKRKRGRRKKMSGNSQSNEKTDVKDEESELSKDFHRPKESRWLFSLSAEKEQQKASKDNTSSAFDIFEFRDEEDEDFNFESVKEKLHDTSRTNASASCSDQKHDKGMDLKHDRAVDQKHDRAVDQKHDRVVDQKNDRTIDSKHDRTIDSKHDRTIDQKHDRTIDQKHDKGIDQKYDRGIDQKQDRRVDQKHDKGTENVHEKEKKTEDTIKPVAVEDREIAPKEPLTEVKEQKRISITIRVSPGCTAEVVKTSEGLNEEMKQETVKNEKTSTKHDTPVSEVPYNGPCKSTRKSTRLMNQAMRSTVDEVIEDVVKAHSEPAPTRMTRRSMSNRRSEESLSKEMAPSENSNDNTDDKNKNRPVFHIPDNTVKDISEEKKKISSQPTETASSCDASATESDKIPVRVQSLRSFRMRPTTNKLESHKDTTVVSNSASNDECQRKDSTPSVSSDEKTDILPLKEHQKVKEASKDLKIALDSSQISHPPLPVLKVEINRVKLDASKEVYQSSEKLSENEEDSNSSPAFLIDPVTGVLAKVRGSYSETNNNPPPENKNCNLVSDLSVYPSVLNIKNISKAVPAVETIAATSVIQESVKSKHPNKSEKVLESSLVQNLRSRQLPNSLPLAVTVPTSAVSFISENNAKHPSSAEKVTEQLKTTIKKNSVTASVLTIANSLIPSASINTVTSAESSAVTNLVYSHTPQGQYPVITGAPVISSPIPATISSVDRKNDIVHPKVSSQSVHSYESPIRTTAVATPTPVGHTTTIASNVQKGLPGSAVTCMASNKSELPVVYTSANIPPIPVSEHISSISSCKPVSLPTSVPLEHSNISIKSEIRAIASPLPSSSVQIPVSTTWPSSKISSNRITDSHAHMGTIQSSTACSAYPSKSEARSSKGAHGGKNNSAFIQQTAFALSNYEDMLPGAHGLVASPSGGVIAELLQNPQRLQQQHKEYLAASGQLQDRNLVQMVHPTASVVSSIPPDIAARLGNSTSPRTPTPPVTSANHSLPPTDMHSHVSSGLHIRHPSQPALIVPPQGLALHPFHHQQMIYAAHNNPYAAAALHQQHEAQARAADYTRFYSTVVTGNFKQPPEPRLHMDAKSEQKVINDLSKIIHETRESEEKSRSKSMRKNAQREKEMKMIKSESRDDSESGRLAAFHEKTPSTSAIAPHSSRQPQHAHYSSQLHANLDRIHLERITDSPQIANLYAAGQGRSQITLAGQVDDHKPDNSLGVHTSHHYKNDGTENIKPPVAHQTQPSTNPYHALEANVHPRQLLGQIGSAATTHLDGRNNPAHSPSSHLYKKDSMSSHHNPANDRVNPEHSKKVLNRTMGQVVQASSISPGLPPAHSPVPWPPIIQSHSSHPSLAQSPHLMLTTNEQSSRRVNHHSSQMGLEVPVHVPPPAHAMSQSINVPRTLPQTPPHASQVPAHGDQFLLQRYPVMWQGLLALKNDQAAVQMHFVSGNPGIARASLPPLIDGETSPVRIAQRMRLEPVQLEGVRKKIQMVEEHCVLMALPCGKDHMDVLTQSSNLKTGFIQYLQSKQAAGIVNAALPGSQQPAYVIHIFPSCDFTDQNLGRIAPDLLQIICEITHLVIVIATV